MVEYGQRIRVEERSIVCRGRGPISARLAVPHNQNWERLGRSYMAHLLFFSASEHVCRLAVRRLAGRRLVGQRLVHRCWCTARRGVNLKGL